MQIENQSLFQITKNLHELELAIIENNGELSKELEESISTETIAKERKIEQYYNLMQRCQLIDEQFSMRAKILTQIAKGAETVSKKLRNNLKFAMKLLETNELCGDTIKFKLTKDTLDLNIFNENVIPVSYFKEVTTYVIDKEKIIKDLKQGIAVEGCELITKNQLRTYPMKGI